MKITICPYCKKQMKDDERSFRFKCAFCKEWLIDLDEQAHRPETYYSKDNNEGEII